MTLLSRALPLLLVFLIAASSSARPTTVSLVEQLGAKDFRVRVRAALELGKDGSDRARVALEKALNDKSAAVRAASAAALKHHGSRKSVSALKRHADDPSPAVRKQIEATLAALTPDKQRSLKGAKVLVQVGTIKVRSSGSGKKLSEELAAVSRAKLAELPGVVVLEAEERGNEVAKKAKVPLVMVTGNLRSLEASTEGSSVVYSAVVEYVVHRMPAQDIAGTVSGSARTRASAKEARNKQTRAVLQRSVVEAAVQSAARRAESALLAAAR